jgi:hypothetical protein
MKLAKTGPVRFTKIVEAAGRPAVVSLWTKPERDKNFTTAVRQSRVVSIKQETVGSAKDFGVVGFLREKNVSYLVFPNSLKEFEDRRIVGIKYDLIETSNPIGRIVKPEAAPTPSRQRKSREWTSESEPATKRTPSKRGKGFTVTIRFNATANVLETVEASSKKAAKKLALKQAVMPDFRRGTATRRVVKIANCS